MTLSISMPSQTNTQYMIDGSRWVSLSEKFISPHCDADLWPWKPFQQCPCPLTWWIFEASLKKTYH